jgi:hypothetical protein
VATFNIFSSGFDLTGTPFANGADILQDQPSYLSGSVQWLDTIGGNNANTGADPSLPVATLAQAVTNSAASGVIIIGANSAETLSGSQSIALAGLAIIGCGTGTSRPRYTCSGAVDLLAISAAGVMVRNIYFPASTAVATSRINLTAASGYIRDCYFECGANDTTRAVRVHTGANNTYVRNCTFAVTASRPAIGLEVDAAVTDCFFESNVFDGGSFGWSDYAWKIDAAATRIRAESNTLLHRSNLGITVAGTSYQLFGVPQDGSNRVFITG